MNWPGLFDRTRTDFRRRWGVVIAWQLFVQLLGFIVLTPLAGWLADRRGRRYFNDARVTPLRLNADNTVDVEVRVHDVWTLSPGFSSLREPSPRERTPTCRTATPSTVRLAA